MPHRPLLGIKPPQSRCIELVFAQLEITHTEALIAIRFARWVSHCQLIVNRPESADIESPEF